jgi:peptidoglycan hydrolase-like protein with peptidoglycan-binding domain
MRDVVLDDEKKLRPVSLLMITTATALTAMILWNGFTARSTSGLITGTATTRMQVAAPSTNTVVFKYDADVEDVQRELLATGHFKGLVDGVMGARTADAIQKYQQDNGLAVTGQPSPELVNHVRYTRKIKAAAEFTGSLQPIETPAPKAIVPTPIAPVAIATPVKQGKRQNILRVQMTLANLGYDLGEPSGILDETTKAAILQFEMDNGLAMDGSVDDQLLSQLSKTAPKKISLKN